VEILLLQISLDPVLVAVIGAIGAILAASIPYYFTKRNEIALNNLKIKLDRYDGLLQKFVKWIQTKDANIYTRHELSTREQISQETPEEKSTASEFIMTYNRASSYASADVLKAVQEYFKIWKLPVPVKSGDEKKEDYRARLKKHNTELREKVDEIFRAIRRDIQTTNWQRSFPFESFIYTIEIQEGKEGMGEE